MKLHLNDVSIVMFTFDIDPFLKVKVNVKVNVKIMHISTLKILQTEKLRLAYYFYRI